MNGWLTRTIMALYTETYTVVRTDAERRKSFKVKVGMHQGSVLSPLLLSCMLSPVMRDGLIRMAPTMAQPGRRVAEWRANLLDKGLQDSAGISKVMVGSSGGKIIVNS